MYYDKKNVIPDYEINASISLDQLSFSIDYNNNSLILTTIMNIENLGRRPISFKEIFIKAKISEKDFIFRFNARQFISNNVVLKVGEIWSERIKLESIEKIQFENISERNQLQEMYNNEKKKFACQTISILLVNGESISSKVK